MVAVVTARDISLTTRPSFQALGEDEVAYVKEQLGFDPEQKFVVPKKAYEYFAECKTKGAEAEAQWNKVVDQYKRKEPKLWQEFEARLNGKFAASGWESLLPAKDKLPSAAQPTRKSSGIAVQALVPDHKTFVAGSADLLESTFVSFKDSVEFQSVSRR